MRAVAKILAKMLPREWRVNALKSSGNKSQRLQITAPDGRRRVLTVLRKARLTPREVVILTLAGGELPNLVTAPYLSPSARIRLTETGINYLDGTGNIRISLSEPGLYIEAVGANCDPNPQRRPSRSLAGAKAGRIVRALCTQRDGWGVREIASVTETNPGYVSRLLASLDREALVERNHRGRVLEVDWRRLIERWAESSPLQARGPSSYCIAPRGLNAVMSKLPKTKLAYAVTGSFATQRFAAVAPAPLLHIYVDSISAFRRDHELTETVVGANIMLIEPKDSSIIDEAEIDAEGTRWAPLVQVASDLLTSQGRGPAEGQALLEWMAKHEKAWRG